MSKPIGQYAVIDAEVCIQCGACEAACPENIPTSENTWYYGVNPARCSLLACDLECKEVCAAHSVSIVTVPTPTNLAVVWGGSAPILSWSQSTSQSLYCEVWGREGVGNQWQLLTTLGPFTGNRQWTDTLLWYIDGITYYYKVRTKNNSGAYSAFSNIASILY